MSDLVEISPLFSLLLYISPLFHQNYYFPLLLQISPLFSKNSRVFLHTFCVFRFPPTLTMMRLCITQCTYWTPLCLVPEVCPAPWTRLTILSLRLVLITVTQHSKYETEATFGCSLPKTAYKTSGKNCQPKQTLASAVSSLNN